MQMTKFFEVHRTNPLVFDEDSDLSKQKERDNFEHRITNYLKNLGLKMNTDARCKEREYYSSKPGVITFVEEIQIQPLR